MNHPDHERLLEAALVWDLPYLRRSLDHGAAYLLEVLNLGPGFYNPDQYAEAAKSNPLGMAADGLRLELTGEREAAHAVYDLLSARPGIEGLIGKLLLAWMPDVDKEAFHTVELEIPSIPQALQVRVRLKLMTWAKNRGWQEVAAEQYERAVETARGELKRAIQFQGHWFGHRQVITNKPLKSDLILYPWISELVGRGASSALEDMTKQLAQSPGTKVWRLGGNVEGTDIQAAGLQGEWAGAHWLLPRVWRQHASIILSRSRDGSEITRGISLWIRGGGSNITGLLERHEGSFDDKTAKTILIDNLNKGGSTKDYTDWIRVCVALWDQMPIELARELTQTMLLPESWATWSRQPVVTESLALFAVLAARVPDVWAQRFQELSDAMRNLVVRSMSRGVARGLPTDAKQIALESVLGEHPGIEVDSTWFDTGWETVAGLVHDSQNPLDREHFLRMIWPGSVPYIAVAYPDLLTASLVSARLHEISSDLSRVLDEMSQGMYGLGGSDPSIDAMRCMLHLGQLDETILQKIVRIALDPAAAPAQAGGALRALRDGLAGGLLPRVVAEDVLQHDRVPRSEGFWDDEADLRMERAERAALAFFADRETVDGVVAATKDPDVRVRHIGLRAIVDATAELRSSVLDSCFMSGLYDPDGSIQAIAAQGVLRGYIQEATINRICWARLIEMWPEAHRTVRSTIASELGRSRGDRAAIAELRRLAVNDRSAMVRLSLNRQ
jgi:hypothetical protein